MRMQLFLLLVMISCFFQQLQAQTITPVPYFPVNGWDSSPYRSFRFTQKDAGHDDWINFRLLFPLNYDSAKTDKKKFPLILSLHGGGESARMKWDPREVRSTEDSLYDNNELQLFHFGKELLEAVESGRFPGFVLSPQNFYGSWIRADGGPETEMHRDLRSAIELLEHLTDILPVDPDRIYIQGISNGGVATWYAAYKRPELFAAALPMSAPGFKEMAGPLADIPLWVFQGGQDDNPRQEITEETVQALEATGVNVRYTLYKDLGHNTWDSAFAEPDIFKWLLAQNKNPEADDYTEEEEEEEEEENSAEEETEVQKPEKDSAEPEETEEETEADKKDKEEKEETQEGTEEEKPNQFPFVSAGSDTVLVLPQNSLFISGTAYDPDGEIVQWEWARLHGPDAKIHSPDSLQTIITLPKEGTYTFRLYTTDNMGAEAFDDLTIRAEPQPLAAGPSQRKNLNSIIPFPNPFTNTLRLKMETARPQRLDVYLTDPAGKLIHHQRIPVQPAGKQVFSLDLEGGRLRPGIYFIRLYIPETKTVKRFMVMKE